MGCRAVCISRSEGAGGAEVGRLVADRLGFAYVDEEVVADAAARGGISPGEVADEERRRSAVTRLLEEIGRGGAVESYGLSSASVYADKPTGDEVRGLIQETIDELAGRGEVVIVSHAASHALAGRPGVLRVLVTGSPERRAERISAREGVAAKDAQKMVKASDSARANYLRRFYRVSHEEPTHYDLVLNTDVLSLDRAADLVARAAG